MKHHVFYFLSLDLRDWISLPLIAAAVATRGSYIGEYLHVHQPNLNFLVWPNISTHWSCSMNKCSWKGVRELWEVKTAAYYMHYHTCSPTTNWHTLSWSLSPHGHALHMLKELNIWLKSMNGLMPRCESHHLQNKPLPRWLCTGTPIFLHPWVLVYNVVAEALPLLAVIGPWQSGQDTR